MKKFSLVLSFIFLFGATAFTQETKPVALPGRAATAFLELGGNGGFLSINYDTRFFKKNNGLGGRIGIGFFPALDFIFFETPTFLTIPVALNYLAGKGPHYLEIGAGITFATGRFDLGSDSRTSAGVVFIPSLGYRFQPLHKGVTVRVAATPLFAGEGETEPWAGLSVGYRF